MVVPRPSFASTPTKISLNIFHIKILRVILESLQTNISTPPFPSVCEQCVGCAMLMVIDGNGGGCWSLLLHSLNLQHITETAQPAHISPPCLEGRCFISVPMRLEKLSFFAALLRFQSVLENFKFCLPSYLSKEKYQQIIN